MGHKIAVVGATGAVGREILTTLSERNFDINDITVLASRRSMGTKVSFGEVGELTVQDLATFDFKSTDIVLSSPGGAVSAIYSPKAAAAGAVVIDNTSHFRMHPDIPLIVPEVNPHALSGYKKRGIVANPNCSTIQMVHALKPLHELGVIRRVVVSTYQAVSGGGKESMDELFNQTRGIFVNTPPEKERFTKQIAFNCIPHIDEFMDDGYTKEEWKMMIETKKILDPNIKLTATCVRIPVFVGHSEAVSVEFEKEVTVEQARKALKATHGISVVDYRQDEGYVTPVEAAGEDSTFVSRIRVDPTVEHGLSLWIVADNLRKGAALNSVQIAELLIKDHLS